MSLALKGKPRRPTRMPPQEHLHDLFYYNVEEECFYWNNPRKATFKRGDIVKGSLRVTGYLFIGVNGYGQIGAHRLVWIYHNGVYDPKLEIDHIDGDKSNNKLSNLRLATRQQQNMNKSVLTTSSSGLKGARYQKHKRERKWASMITYNGNSIYLGHYETPEEAHEVYKAAANKYFGEFAKVFEGAAS